MSIDYLRTYFSGFVPHLFEFAHKKGHLDYIISSFKRVAEDLNVIEDRKIIESILAVGMNHCDNKYCVIMHSFFLTKYGFTDYEVRRLIERQILPNQIKDRGKWEKVLRITSMMFNSYLLPAQSFETIKSILNAAEYDDYCCIIGLAYHLKFFIECYRTEIDIKKESIIINTPNGIDLVKYFEENSLNIHLEKQPVFLICCNCKDLKDDDGKWYPIEKFIDQLPQNSHFSHGICPPCKQIILGK